MKEYEVNYERKYRFDPMIDGTYTVSELVRVGFKWYIESDFRMTRDQIKRNFGIDVCEL